MGTGILFVEATWSGPSAGAFGWLTRKMVASLSCRDQRLMVVDTDDLSEHMMAVDLGHVLGGWGEAFWIKRGQIVAQVLRWNESEMSKFESYCQRLSSE